MYVLLRGTVGSTAYGLATARSDVDTLAVHAASTADLLSLRPPQDTVVSVKPDITSHEALKYCRLALNCNPTILELMWLPAGLVDTSTEHGDALVDMRRVFLSRKRVRDAYLGYATQQFQRLARRGDGSFSSDTRKRTAKHARHMMRLLIQGFSLYSSGTMSVQLDEPKLVHEFGDHVAGGNFMRACQVMETYEEYFNRTRSPLPESPGEAAVESWLRWVRKSFYADNN